MKNHIIKLANPDGTFTYMEPKSSLWYMLNISGESQSKKEKSYFEKGFASVITLTKIFYKIFKSKKHLKGGQEMMLLVVHQL